MSVSPAVLASASPRRRRLIGWLGFEVSHAAVDTPEDLTAPLAPPDLAASLAAEKAVAARAALGGEALVLAFDTVVVSDGRVLGKPAGADDARRMLRLLSGRTHDVVTGVALLPAGADSPDTFAVTTVVQMRALDAAAIESWIARGEALGCAGAYNIEHHLASVAEDECFQNVAGLPLCHLYAELASGRAGRVPEGLTPPVAPCDAALDRRCLLGPRVCGSVRADGTVP
ncbi:MAG: Maf family protein [Coriobacteriia bacterium]|nr:Maf family protein [Coriobacteriia bacterium]MBN2847178.1 Maf family protein [Coriobacteriia bacterium]